MFNRRLLPLVCLAAAGWVQGGFSAAVPASAEQLTAALVAARGQPTTPFRLDVNCSDEASNRAVVVYRGRIGIWNGDRQVNLDDETRNRLLTRLLESNFPSFEARYGGRTRAPRQEAPLRVTCRVHLELGAMSKTSVQLLEGAQSAGLLEPLTANAIVPGNLEDGLAKLATGELAGEALQLRLTALPSAPDRDDGYILRIGGGQFSHQTYAPGRVVGEPVVRPLDDCVREEAVAALRAAPVWNLPANLQNDRAAELSVAILGHRSTLIARPGFKAAPAPAQEQFARLVERLETRFTACPGQAGK